MCGIKSRFSVIGSHFTMKKEETSLVLITSLASIIQTACQTMFILDASRRNAATAEHMRKKPGREIVTFLLVANLAMWAICTLEKSRAESHPIQLNFYGLWAWTIITHFAMPLAIFYRFHSTVCSHLCPKILTNHSFITYPCFRFAYAKYGNEPIKRNQRTCEEAIYNLVTSPTLSLLSSA